MIRLAFPFLLAAALTARAEDFQGATHRLEYDEEPVKYSDTESSDPIAQLQKKIDAGEVKLRWDDRLGYLPAVMETFKVPVESQTVVFSKTSLQRKLISPQTPRALFFNDDLYLGYIPDAPVMEISVVDPQLGAVFYTLDQEKVRKPKFTRSADCLACHGAQRTLGVPGHFVRSVQTDLAGEIDSVNEFHDIDHCKPLADRWAGWFVTGQSGNQTHKGNLIGADAFAKAEADPLAHINRDTLDDLFDTSRYPRNTSDIAALMILEHQGKMHNYITRLAFETRHMMAAYGHTRYLTSQVNAFLRHLLFTEEAPLTGPLTGDPAYLRAFAAAGPRDSRGRSLRDPDMRTRMFRHPCSYLIYSASFDAIPAIMRDHLLQRLHDILTGKDNDPQFSKLPAEDRRAILEILRETKKNLPSYWHEPAKSTGG